MDDEKGPALQTSTYDKTGLQLLVVAAAQLLMVMDGTIVTVGLPSIGAGLHMSGAHLNWVLTAYALAFGGLMLAGGRAGDLLGRRRLFQGGLVLFLSASLLGGFATNGGTLIAARALQGVAAAVIAPAALSLLADTFPAGPARTRAFGVYGAMGGLGAVVGLLLGGALTELAGWRWIMLVNVPIAAALLAGAPALAPGTRDRGGMDLPGTVTAAGGLTALVYAINRAATYGWTDSQALTAATVSAVGLMAFARTQRRARTPLVPAAVLADRGRVGANLVMLLMGAGMLATFYFLSVYLQVVKQYPPMVTGLAFLPMAVSIGISTGVIGPRLLTVTSGRTLTVAGMALAALGTSWLSLLAPGQSPWTALLPAQVVVGAGLGMGFLVCTTGGVRGVADQHTGIASGILNTSHQVGGALGLAVLAGLAASVTSGHADDAATSEALTAGFTTGLRGGVAVYLTAALIAAITFASRTASPATNIQPRSVAA
jgi:EmrB/QacA subfamily drug resistance transporter